MNKVIKFVLLVLFIVISISSANIVKNNFVDKQIEKNYDVQDFTQIYLPSSISSDKNLISLVEGVSAKTGASFIFRSTYGGVKNDGKGHADLLKMDSKAVFYKTNYQTSDKKTFVSHGFSCQLWSEPLKNITTVEQENSDVYIKNKNIQTSLQDFLIALNKKYGTHITSKKLTTRPSDFYPNNYTSFIGLTNDNLSLFIGISIVFFAIFLFVWLVGNNKKIATYRLNGVSAHRIGLRLFLKEFFIVTLLAYIFSSFLVFRGFNLQFSLQMFIMLLLVIIVSYISIVLVSSFSLANQINSKSFFKYSHYVLYAVKAFVFLITVFTTATLLYFVNAKLEITSKIGQEYAVLYPEFSGYDGGQPLNLSCIDLFVYAEEHDGLYISDSSIDIVENDSLNDLQINDNYLSKFAIYSQDNQRVEINPDTNSGIILVSEKYKSQLSKIKKYYASSDSLAFFKGSTIKYYFIKDAQKLDLLDENSTKISPDLVEVYTRKNFTDKGNVTFQHNTVLKFKIRGTIEKTYQPLIPILKKNSALETHPSMIKIDDISKTDNLSTVGNPYNYAVTNGLVILIFLSMILTTTVFYFETYKKKIAVKRLYGISFFVTYKTLFAIVLVQGSLYFAFALSQRDVNITLEGLGIYFVLEILIIILILLKLQKGLFLNVLKGE